MTMRVLHVITRLTRGGATESTVAGIVALRHAGYDCVLAAGLAESDVGVAADARRRCPTVDVPGLGREAHPGRDLAALARLAALMARTRPRVVHTHTSKAGFLGRFAARLTRVPVVIHHPHGHVFYGYWGHRRTRLYIRLERLAARWCDRIVTLTDREAGEHRERGIGRPEQFVTVPSGVPTATIRAAALPRAAARRELGLPLSAFVVAGLGRLVPVKGFDLLVAALPALRRDVPDAIVVLLGDGPERGALEARARALGVADRLRLVGARPEAWRVLAAADVLAAPSRNEGMGRALVEAMAVGVPVVGTAVGGIPEVVADGTCGRVVAGGDVGALAAALADLGRDPALVRKYGDAAAHRAERFSTAVADARMLALYADLLGRRGLR
jgi:glycosyltransferase involved in cell wall biosynthesis